MAEKIREAEFEVKRIKFEDSEIPPGSLLLDTSGDYLVAAVSGLEPEIFYAAEVYAPRTQQELIFLVLEKLQQEAGFSKKFLPGVIICGKGPGAYTSIRVGVSAARAIAQVAESKVLALDSLEVIAASHFLLSSCASGKTAVVRDAKMGQLYFLSCEFTNSLVVEEKSAVLSIEEVRAKIEKEGYFAVITDTPSVEELIKGTEIIYQNPLSIGLIDRANHHFREKKFVSWRELLPEYLRLSYAEQSRRKA